MVAPLILAHPLALFPALSAVPQSFLPAGVALFIPAFCILAALSACAHIVIVYLAWYLKVGSFEQVFAACAGERFGRFGQAVGRGFVVVATLASSVGWLGTVASLLDPVVQEYLPNGVLRSRIFWTITGGIFVSGDLRWLTWLGQEVFQRSLRSDVAMWRSCPMADSRSSPRSSRHAQSGTCALFLLPSRCSSRSSRSS